MRGLLYLGRWLFSLIFILTIYTHLQAGTQTYALAYGIPPWLTVTAAVVACVGGLMVATGWRSREGAVLLAGFLVPVTLTMHRFWGLSDPMQKAMQTANFMKNVSLLGASLMIVYFGSSPWGATPSGVIEVKHRPRARKVGAADLLTPGTRL